MDSLDTVEANQNGLFLTNLIQYTNVQKDGSNQSMLQVIEAERILHICLHRATMTMDAYNTEFKSRVQVCEALVLRVSATKSAEKVVAEEDGIYMSILIKPRYSFKQLCISVD